MQKQQEEIWKDVPGYEGIYKASNLGRIKTLERFIQRKEKQLVKEKILKSNKNKHGYLKCVLCLNKKRKYIQVHQVIAMTFLNHIPNSHKIVVDHINNVKTDNRAENLQLISCRENVSKSVKKSSSEYIGVSWSKNHNKWCANIHYKGKLIFLGHFDNELDASEYYKNALISIEKKEEIKKKPFITTSKYVGVHFSKEKKIWVSKIKIKGKSKHLGYFKIEEDARDCYLNFKKSML